MANRNFIFILILICSAISCKRNPDILVEVKESDFRNKTDVVINGEQVLNVIGASGCLLFDTLFMVITNDPSSQLKVFSSNTLKPIGSLCPKGRARNEFIKAILPPNQVYYNELGHVILPLMNYDAEVKEVDVTESLIEGKTIIKGVVEYSSAGGTTIYLDNRLDYRFEYISNKYEYDEERKGVPSLYTVVQPNGKKKEIKIFDDKMDIKSERNEIYPYIGVMYKHPSRNLVVQPFSYMEYLLYFDFDSDTQFAIHQKDALSFNDLFDRKNKRENYYSFTDAATTENYFIILYWRGDYFLDVPDRKGAEEVLVFDWNGNYMNGFKLDRQISRIEYDEKKHILYGLESKEEKIYAYNLEDYLQ